MTDRSALYKSLDPEAHVNALRATIDRLKEKEVTDSSQHVGRASDRPVYELGGVFAPLDPYFSEPFRFEGVEFWCWYQATLWIRAVDLSTRAAVELAYSFEAVQRLELSYPSRFVDPDALSAKSRYGPMFECAFAAPKRRRYALVGLGDHPLKFISHDLVYRSKRYWCHTPDMGATEVWGNNYEKHLRRIQDLDGRDAVLATTYEVTEAQDNDSFSAHVQREVRMATLWRAQCVALGHADPGPDARISLKRTDLREMYGKMLDELDQRNEK